MGFRLIDLTSRLVSYNCIAILRRFGPTFTYIHGPIICWYGDGTIGNDSTFGLVLEKEYLFAGRIWIGYFTMKSDMDLDFTR